MLRTLLATTFVGASLLSAVPVAHAQNAPYCLLGSDSGVADCSYNNPGQCEAAKKGAATTGICIRNRGE